MTLNFGAAELEALLFHPLFLPLPYFFLFFFVCLSFRLSSSFLSFLLCLLVHLFIYLFIFDIVLLACLLDLRHGPRREGGAARSRISFVISCLV